MPKTNIANFILNEFGTDSNLLGNHEYNSHLIDTVVENWSKKRYISPKTYSSNIYFNNTNDKHFV